MDAVSFTAANVLCCLLADQHKSYLFLGTGAFFLGRGASDRAKVCLSSHTQVCLTYSKRMAYFLLASSIVRIMNARCIQYRQTRSAVSTAASFSSCSCKGRLQQTRRYLLAFAHLRYHSPRITRSTIATSAGGTEASVAFQIMVFHGHGLIHLHAQVFCCNCHEFFIVYQSCTW